MTTSSARKVSCSPTSAFEGPSGSAKNMKKLLNDPRLYVDEMLDGLCAAHPDYFRRLGESGRVIARAGGAVKGKVGIVSGGGSGHLPLFTGYVGPGFIDACAIGNVFAGPSVDDCVEAMRAADGGAGVLRLYGNYGGDRMNFDMAGELLDGEGIETTTVLGADDVASAPAAEKEKRRGVAGLIYVYKIAGAKAETKGATLREVTGIATKASAAVATTGVALGPCTGPDAGKPTFILADDEIEIGLGIHQEPGISRGQVKAAVAVAGGMIEPILRDLHVGQGEPDYV